MNKSSLVLVGFFLCLSIDICMGRDTPHWDVLIFTQSWPITFCREWKEQGQSHSCTLPDNPKEWTVHGIWPTKFGTKGPSFCNRTWHFDPDAIKPIEENLIHYWTNVEKGTPLYELWSHEWTKHGTCAAVLEPLNSELKYFSQGLNWVQKYNVFDILASAGINPGASSEYTISDINRALKLRLGVDPVIECYSKHGKAYLSQVLICFDKNLNLTNCDGVVGYDRFKVDGDTVLTTCHLSSVLYPQDVNYETQTYTSKYVQLYRLVTWLQWLTM